MPSPRRLSPLVLLLAAAGAAPAQAPYYPTAPVWESKANFNYATGLGLADLDRDGWPDMVVANGNDMGRQRLEVFYNRGGLFPADPDWTSADVDYNGHLAVGDVDGDGWPDVVVAVFLGPNRFGDKGRAKLYLNDGKGALGRNPAWLSSDTFFCFSVALGDVDGDGDLDLAAATGENYYDPPDYNRLYLNQGGSFQGLPAWQSAIKDHSMGALIADMDGDGRLDLVFAGHRDSSTVYPSTIYFNRGGGQFSTNPDWRNTDNSTSIMAAAGDLDGDGLPELILADNNQVGGSGRFKFYRNSAQGLQTVPAWSSAFDGYGACLALADLDLDGRLDLAAGAWWEQVRVYRNTGGTFNAQPDWVSAIPTSAAKPVPEALVFRDTSRAGLFLHSETFTGDGARKVFTLRRVPVESFLRVAADGVELAPGQWCADPDRGWVALAAAPARSLRVDTIASYLPALAVSNWERMQGNYLFRREPELARELFWVFDWIAPGQGMWPFVETLRNLRPTPFAGTLEALLLDAGGGLVRKVSAPLNLGPGAGGLSWGYFPADWGLAPGLYAVQLRVLSGGIARHLQEFPLEIRPPLGAFR